jgi:hypothetical protein
MVDAGAALGPGGGAGAGLVDGHERLHYAGAQRVSKNRWSDGDRGTGGEGEEGCA